ncbi:hypothetical protein ElyMa_006479600 [Elysia marginata]|uniref:Uncharacterized protein n=1 Tax=Elysia marginata TaxID=1093978 RepID=A0AAV4I474_9GAST|nr:hypothetical protein ElyMa_006479600 [Elysia marginata]
MCLVADGGGETNSYQIRNHADGVLSPVECYFSLPNLAPGVFESLWQTSKSPLPDIRPLSGGRSPNNGGQSSPGSRHKGRLLAYPMLGGTSPLPHLFRLLAYSVIKSYLECNLSTHRPVACQQRRDHKSRTVLTRAPLPGKPACIAWDSEISSCSLQMGEISNTRFRSLCRGLSFLPATFNLSNESKIAWLSAWTNRLAT